MRAEFNFSAREQRLRAMAEGYHEETERFDRTVCTGPVRGDGVMPSNGYESRLINENAWRARRRILTVAQQEGFTPREIDDAIRQVMQ